jgi:hypothetical protein
MKEIDNMAGRNQTITRLNDAGEEYRVRKQYSRGYNAAARIRPELYEHGEVRQYTAEEREEYMRKAE